MNSPQTTTKKLNSSSIWMMAAALFTSVACGETYFTTGSASEPGGAPEPSGSCENGATRAGAKACGPNDRGTLEEVCQDGHWLTGSTCQETDACIDGKTRTGDTACGLNQRGLLQKSCTAGRWTDSTTCDDPDECTDGEKKETKDRTTCMDGAGWVQPSCVNGTWQDGCTRVLYRISVDSKGSEADDTSDESSISANGRYVAFGCFADNLVSGDTNKVDDVFVYDLETSETRRVSVSSEGTQGDKRAFSPSISEDGRYVVFASFASNLVSHDTKGFIDIFAHDLVTGETRRVSVSSDGTQANSNSKAPRISANGRYVAFASTATNLVEGDSTSELDDVFVHDLETGSTERISTSTNKSEGNNYSDLPAISADGRYVAFESLASNLVGDDTNGVRDVFIHDRNTGETRRVSTSSEGTQANSSSYGVSISADGRYVAFESDASNLVSGDTNVTSDVFVHDNQTGETRRVSVDSKGAQSNGPSHHASISADHLHVAFQSAADNLVSGDTNSFDDIFVHDLATGETRRVGQNGAGAQANGGSFAPSISANGQRVVFASRASNLLSTDTNSTDDIFVSVGQ